MSSGFCRRRKVERRRAKSAQFWHELHERQRGDILARLVGQLRDKIHVDLATADDAVETFRARFARGVCFKRIAG